MFSFFKWDTIASVLALICHLDLYWWQTPSPPGIPYSLVFTYYYSLKTLSCPFLSDIKWSVRMVTANTPPLLLLVWLILTSAKSPKIKTYVYKIFFQVNFTPISVIRFWSSFLLDAYRVFSDLLKLKLGLATLSFDGSKPRSGAEAYPKVPFI